MKEHLELSITERFGKLIEKVRGEGVAVDVDAEPKIQKKSVIESALRMATTRVILAKDVGELSDQLKEVSKDLEVGKDAEKVDGLRAAVMMKVEEVVASDELIAAQRHIDNLLAQKNVYQS